MAGSENGSRFAARGALAAALLVTVAVLAVRRRCGVAAGSRWG